MADETPQDPTEQEGAPVAPEAAAPQEDQTVPEAEATADEAAAPAEEQTAPEVVADAGADDEDYEEDPVAPREKPAIPGADLEVDIVLDGEETRQRYDEDGEFLDEDAEPAADEDEVLSEPITAVSIDLGAAARYSATGKRKSAVARGVALVFGLLDVGH